jgi:hypothetical protein
MFTEVAVNFGSDSYGSSFPGLLFSINEEYRDIDFKIASGSDSGVISTSVFGTAGNRYSILVIEKEYLTRDYAGRNGKWSLTAERKTTVEFELLWAVEASGSGCLVLCGKEVPSRFTASVQS